MKSRGREEKRGRERKRGKNIENERRVKWSTLVENIINHVVMALQWKREREKVRGILMNVC